MSFTILPTSKFSEFRHLFESALPASLNLEDSVYIRTYPSQLKTYYHAFPGIIFEVLPSSDSLVSVTLF